MSSHLTYVRVGKSREDLAEINQQTPRISRVKVVHATALHSLFKPQSEICSVTNHFQEIWRVDFLIFLRPHTANEFRRLHSPGNEKTGGKMLSTNKNSNFCLCIKILFLPSITTWYFTNPMPPKLLQNITFWWVLECRRKYIVILIEIR